MGAAGTARQGRLRAVTAAIAVGMVGLAGVQAWAGWRGGAVGWLAIGPLAGSLLVVLLLSGFAMLNAVVRQRRDAQLAEISAVARVAQSAILRPVPARVGRMEFAARYQSAAQGARVGGDLLDVVEGPEGICVVVGDVRGKACRRCGWRR